MDDKITTSSQRPKFFRYKGTTMSTPLRSVRTQFVAVAMVIAMVVVATLGGTQRAVQASEAGPGGFNIAFDFSWNDVANPPGYSASFLENDGTTTNNCAGGGLTPSTLTCNFVFDYKIDGTTQASVKHAARWVTWSNPVTYVGGKPATSGCSSPTADGGTFGKAPLTLFDCFNSNSFGQVIFPAVSGALTEFRMKATCLVPSGTTPLDLYALVYELNADATKIPGASPIAATYVPLTSCPRATTWQGKTFRSSDFSYLNIPFTGVSLSAGKFYGIYFAGKGVPGTPPVGAAPALERARQATTTTTTSTTTTTPWSAFKNQKNVIPKTATTIARTTGSATTTTTTTVKRTTASTLPAIPRPTLTALPASLGVNTALRTMLKADEARFILKSTTPLNCVTALRFVIATKAGTCRINVAKRSNGFVLQTISLKVAKTGVLGPDIVAVNEPVTVYFTGGTSNFQKTAAKTLKTTAVAAKNANVVFVGGYTGNVTNDAVNEKLAEVRASKTRSALREAGVTATIAVMSFGSSGAVTKGKSNAEQNRNRRAVIYIVP